MTSRGTTGGTGPLAPWHGSRRERVSCALAFAALFGLQLACLLRMHSPELVDDAPFYFRYAENLAAGHGYRWNVEEPPVWGASAPLWPLLLAFGVKLGLGAQQASLVWSWLLTLSASGLLGLVAHRLFGNLGVLALAPLLAVNYLYSLYATSALETPLGHFLLASALVACAYEAPGLVLGVVAGACLVHKIDFAPLGLALLAGAWRWRRPVAARTCIAAGLVALAWYGFALWHFGSLVPNSLLRKLHESAHPIGREWFAATLLWRGSGAWLAFLVPLGIAALRRHGLLLCATLGAFLPQLAVYTLRPPSEPFEWYAAACAPAVAFLAACGLAWSMRALPGVRLVEPRVRRALATAVVLLATLLAARLEGRRVYWMHRYLRSIEPLRVEAGEWIAHHTPPEARLYTGFGLIAYHSRRFVYDGSFLNRHPEDNLIGKYRPEFLAYVVVRPEDEPPLVRNYRIAQTFSAPGSERPKVYVMERK